MPRFSRFWTHVCWDRKISFGTLPVRLLVRFAEHVRCHSCMLVPTFQQKSARFLICGARRNWASLAGTTVATYASCTGHAFTSVLRYDCTAESTTTGNGGHSITEGRCWPPAARTAKSYGDRSRKSVGMGRVTRIGCGTISALCAARDQRALRELTGCPEHADWPTLPRLSTAICEVPVTLVTPSWRRCLRERTFNTLPLLCSVRVYVCVCERESTN